MPISAAVNVQMVLNGDGASTLVDVDLSKMPFVFLDGDMSNDFTFKGINPPTPTAILVLSLDDSTTNRPTAIVAGDVITFSFATPLAAGLHLVNCAVVF